MILDEDVSIKKIKQLYSELKKELEDNDQAIVDFSAVRRVDLAVIQLIISAAREAKEQGKTIRLKSVSDDVRYQMSICGLKT